jgi:hypothetical protein
MGGLEIKIGTQTPCFGDHGPATRNSNNKIFSNLTSRGGAGAKEGMNETHCNRI